MCTRFWWIFYYLFFQFKVVRDTINHFLTFLDSKKQKPAIIIQHRALCSTLYKAVFPIQQVSSHFFHICFWLKVMTLPYLCLDKVSVCWNIGCLFISRHWKGYIQGDWSLQASMERRGRYRKESSSLQLRATHRLWSLHQKPANERVTVTGSALSSVCQQKIQMKEFTQTGLTAHEVAS